MRIVMMTSCGLYGALPDLTFAADPGAAVLGSRSSGVGGLADGGGAGPIGPNFVRMPRSVRILGEKRIAIVFDSLGQKVEGRERLLVRQVEPHAGK